MVVDVYTLQEQLNLLHKYPGGYMDLEPGTTTWMHWWRVFPEDQTAMLARQASPRTMAAFSSFDQFIHEISNALASGTAFIEVFETEMKQEVASGLNLFLSACGLSVRIVSIPSLVEKEKKEEVTDEQHSNSTE